MSGRGCLRAFLFLVGGIFALGLAAAVGVYSYMSIHSASYRYKLTLSLNTSDGVRTGYNVVQLDYFDVRFPMEGTPHKTHGQGIYIDLGPGRRPLIALLMRIPRATDPWPGGQWWQEDAPTWIAPACLNAEEFHAMNRSGGVIEGIRRIARQCHQPIMLPLPPVPINLPDLVTFSDVNDPQSILLVDPDNLEATLGPGVSWRSIAIQTTDEPLTTGIENHLPWVSSYRGNLYVEHFNVSKTSRGPFFASIDFMKR